MQSPSPPPSPPGTGERESPFTSSAGTCAIVLAAGLSRRMGAGVQKLLLPYGGSTVIGHVISQLAAAPVQKVLVVVGRDQRVAGVAVMEGAIAIRNDDPDGDMLSSARRGLRALPRGHPYDPVLLALGDQPAITSHLVRRMIETFATCGRGIVVPVFNGRRGHPLLFASHYAAVVLTRYAGVGVRGLLEAHPDDTFPLEVFDPGVVADIDVPEDYRREVARLRTPATPPPPAGE